MEKKESSAPFWIMMVILLYMFIACILCPLLFVGNPTYMSIRLPLMGLALALPFVHFLIFAGMEIVRRDKK